MSKNHEADISNPNEGTPGINTAFEKATKNRLKQLKARKKRLKLKEKRKFNNYKIK